MTGVAVTGAAASRRLTTAFLAFALSACARPGAPVGGPVPETPLRVLETTPPHLGRIDPFAGPVELRFERTLSERPTAGSLSDAVIVSPQTGLLTVRVSGDRIEISMEGGFRDATVYRVTLLPRFRDRYQNGMAGPLDVVFSTGPELEPTLLAGMTQDRLTLRALGGARVDAVPLDGGSRRSTVSDGTGVFTFPYMPSGRYALVAYEDRNRSGEADFAERQASVDVGVNVGDTIVVTDLPLLLPDTIAAELERASVLDSLTLGITFDDYLDAEGDLGTVVARLIREGSAAPEVVSILFRWEWDERQAAAAPDAQATPAPLVLPTRELVLELSRPLIAGAQYRVEIEGVINLNDVPGGGGQAEFEGPEGGLTPVLPPE